MINCTRLYLFYSLSALIIFLFRSNSIQAQSYQLIHHYTIDKGLPSNMVYNMAQDSMGNLWIATNNGISRYDGKYFRNYTYKDGLPSNDVVYLKIDAYGVLWLNCFGHKPTYYENDAFHILKDTANQITNQNYILGSTFENEANYMWGNSLTEVLKNIVCKENKTYEINSCSSSQHYETAYMGREIKWLIHRQNGIADVKIFYKGTCTDSLKTKLLMGYASNKDKGGIITRTEKVIYEFTLNQQHKIVQKEYEADAYIINACYFENYFMLIDAKAKVYIYDRHTSQLLNKLQAPIGAQCAFIDNNEQLWIGTKNDGLYCYAESKIARYLNEMPNNNFLSVYTDKQGNIIAGNGFKQTYEIIHGKHTQYNYPNTKIGGSIKNILPQANGIYLIEDNGVLKYKTRYKFSHKYYNKIELQLKAGLVVNDSILFLGTVNGTFYLNTNTGKLTTYDDKNRTRVYACTKDEHQNIYYTQTDRIYKVKYPSIQEEVLPIHFNENELPISLTYTHDNLLWVATNESRIYIVQRNKTIDTLTEETALLQNLTHITSQGNQIVVSCKTGLAIINYTFNETLKYDIRYVTQQDGLPSGAINQAFMANDSIYVATENGIGVLHKYFVPHRYSITPAIQSIRINNELVPLQKEYQLKAGAYNISIQLSGVDLSGHLYAMQYALNDTSIWNTIEGNQLSLILQGDETKLYIRCKDNQNKVGKGMLACTFNVAIPFYKKLWFLAFIAIGFTSFVFWLINKRKHERQKIEFEKQLALVDQRNRITADLHDDIGATLSSLQLNSTIANKGLNNSKVNTSDILHTIESQAKELSEKIGDIIWSLKNEEAFGTFTDRIKTYTSQILDFTNIEYKINIDDQIDAYIKGSIMKKNLILISKEAINNAVKYSQAKLLIIECTLQENKIHIRIADDGIGFEEFKRNGNGLKNMRQRVAELQGEISIQSKLNKGTVIEIYIPTIIRGK